MKTEKESSVFRIFWFLCLFAPKFLIFSFAILPLQIGNYLRFVIPFFLALFWAKNEIDKQDLENKIFELKQLIEKKE